MIRRATAALILSFASPALAEDFVLELPIDCDLGTESCFIQQYMDRDPGPDAIDYQCAGLSYDGHKGTDFGLPTYADIARNVPVIASATGRVLGVRDGIPDTGVAADVDGRECGNGVVLEHEDGWQTQYCHLKRGSVKVTRGQIVEVGEVMGYVGQSGKAGFPHVHLSVRKDGTPVDPFDPKGEASCGTPADGTLWAETPIYQPGGLLDAGFTDKIPDFADVKAGTADAVPLEPASPAIVLFGLIFGTQANDVLRMRIEGPNGMLIEDDQVMERDQAQAFRAFGRRKRANDWPAGAYDGSISLIRDGKTISTLFRQINIE
ncbi:M23 family metallopeptidase [Sulfitobacter sp. JB4-11]|uniref:M23 family metallopeptidase n=1 Tax=Sulfitobacter rhodophyticola TaxID=3238304 RepID=UPI0035184087